MEKETSVNYNKQFLEREMQKMAGQQQITLAKKPVRSIVPLLEDAKEILTTTYRELANAAKQKRELQPAGEWLLDNFYIVQEQIVQLKVDFPSSYYSKLPRMSSGEFKGLPRVYELVEKLVDISDNIVDPEKTGIAVRAYQEVQTLKLGELWAVPILIRLSLIERLRDKSILLLEHRKIRDKVDEVMDEIIINDSVDSDYLLMKFHAFAEAGENDNRFLTTLAQRLQNAGWMTDAERYWLDHRFKKWNTSLEEQLRLDAQRTSRLQLSIQNAISTLRKVSETDWSEFVEECSIVERILRLDPSGFYSKMDFKTRDRYRKVIEKLSEGSSKSESEIAQNALLLAEKASNGVETKASRESHIGYYLLGDGYSVLFKKVKYRMPWDEKIQRWLGQHPLAYFGLISGQLILLLVIVAAITGFLQAPAYLILITLGAAFFPALDLSVVFTNRLLSLWLPPRILPKLDHMYNIPDDYRTMVVVPTLFSSIENVEKQFEELEIRSLANPGRELQYVFLSDFVDANEETLPSDKAILETAKVHVERLNKKYKSKYGNKFFLLHRKREWNDAEGVWMGWERKRGKLELLNYLLCNVDEETPFITLTAEFRQSVRDIPVQYIITLDADTQMPPGSAINLVRTIAHPLNRAQIDQTGKIVEDGYGIIQPRISITPKSAMKSWFAHIYSGNVGLDPYTTAVSDIYQDLFGEGIYTGKGIYDVGVFNELLCNRLPENTILSHDLLESTYLRCGLATDIELFDDFPANYINYVKRSHRWIRGDWQILFWLFPKTPAPDSHWEKNPINTVSRWKIFDNLRRTFNPIFLLIFLILGWTVLPGHAIVWTLAVFGVSAFPIYSNFTTELFSRPERVKWQLYLEKIKSSLKVNSLQAFTNFIFLPHLAYISLDAVLRTLWRLMISKKHLLEWVSASQVESTQNNSLLRYYSKMWVNIVWALLCWVVVAYAYPKLLYLVIPLSIAWILAPGFARLTANPYVQRKKKQIPLEYTYVLRKYMRKTWHYFEKYVNEEHSWLPPDNLQEDPYIGTVNRTSPTNIGLGISSSFVAFEQGYITATELLQRTENTFESMEKLEKYAGHFYNWYSTKLGEILNPHYISTVDSGNLAANLIFVKQATLKLSSKSWPNPAFWNGLKDTIWVIEELKLQYINRDSNLVDLQARITDLLLQINQELPDRQLNKPTEWREVLQKLLQYTYDLSELKFHFIRSNLTDYEFEEFSDWFHRPYLQVKAQLVEIVDYLNRKTNPSQDYQSLLHADAFPEFENKITKIANTCTIMVEEMDFSILYVPKRDLFSIGYNVDRAALDISTYDLLASEARLASFLAIAKGEAPPKHWFKLSRRLTSIESNEILLSWGGTMFEYLMPLLYLNHFEETLMSNTNDKAVQWQIKFGIANQKPWGFSESGYSILNMELHYQYRAFGVPGLGLKRGLAEDYVVSPYSSMLALMVEPMKALSNLDKLRKIGAYGMNGFYESIDYTPNRSGADSGKNIVKMYMAHHQGMSLLAMANALHHNLIQDLFHNEPMVQACELLLQERIPLGIPIKEPHPIDVELEPGEYEYARQPVDHSGKDELFNSPSRTHFLSNGNYSLMITHAGTGYSMFQDLSLTRWRAERVKDAWGFFFYIRDVDRNNFWSSGFRPVNKMSDRYDTWFHAGKVQIARVDDWIETFMELCVSPEDNIELRKLTLTNYSDEPRHLEITSYAEVVINHQEADMAHRAFSNLFVQTEYIPEHHSLIAKRRPRSTDEEPYWLVHSIAAEGMNTLKEPFQYETDRQKFIGRGRSLDNPIALEEGQHLSGSIGNVPDPIVSMRIPIVLSAGEKKSVTFSLGIAESRKEAIDMANHYNNSLSADRAFELATIYGSVELDHIGISGKQAHYFQKLAGSMIYGNDQLRINEETILRNRKLQSDLWAYGISGDHPILVYRIQDKNHIKFVSQLLKAHTFWRLRGLKVDIVFINDHPPSYLDELQDAINDLIQTSPEQTFLNKRGGIFLLKGEELSTEFQILLETVAVAVLKGRLLKLDFRSIQEPLMEWEKQKNNFRQLEFTDLSPDENIVEPDLLFYNGYGGFSKSGKEYIILLRLNDQGTQLEYPPSPWINVIANPEFGFISSERGSDYTWSLNSRENRLTPWSNDATIDPAGEAIYIRDESKRVFWSPTPGPTPGSTNYKVIHGFGYTQHLSNTKEIDQELTKWVPVEDTLKVIRLRMTNTADSTRSFSVYHYLEWVLGVFREHSSKHIITEFDRDLKSIIARNNYNNEFANRVAFATYFTELECTSETYTCDRMWFIGKNRGVTAPRALCDEDELSGRSGAGFDPCAASRLSFSIPSGETAVIYFLLGETSSMEAAKTLIRKYKNSSTIEQSFDDVRAYWNKKLGKIKVTTPLQDMDILFNGWLQYQNISCRLWGRSGFYQSGGAYGFRDQLQDAAAALYIDPSLTREQILLHAKHQFAEGDVLHWWHPPTSRGVRTRITDDLLWLPYVTSFYIESTGDDEILNEKLAFITARTLGENEHEAYLIPSTTNTKVSLYEHCCCAIDRSLTKGAHGLPLIGSGDWNDGMDNVGEKGKGESVWLGFFLYTVLSGFIPLCKKFGDEKRLERYTAFQADLKEHLNREGWDGEWYLRAFYDDGSPLGSSKNEECMIDAIAQAWAVISGVASEQKALKALDSAGKHLVSSAEGLIRLLTPPFDQTEKNPGYIKGYLPGVRENGGQYTHAALWLVKAYAEMGFGQLATELIHMLSPVQHALSKVKADKYKVEPYVVAADIYSEPPLAGMGGWTWYTGSAAWMYRVYLESILGLKIKNGNIIEINPAISAEWKSYTIEFIEEDGQTNYHIELLNDKGLEKGKFVGSFDGEDIERDSDIFSFKMKSDGKNHTLKLKLVKSKESINETGS